MLAPERQERLVLALAVKVDPERHLGRLVLAPARYHRLVLPLAVDVGPERHLDRLGLVRQ